jgi:hypothetical protein
LAGQVLVVPVQYSAGSQVLFAPAARHKVLLDFFVHAPVAQLSQSPVQTLSQQCPVAQNPVVQLFPTEQIVPVVDFITQVPLAPGFEQ